MLQLTLKWLLSDSLLFGVILPLINHQPNKINFAFFPLPLFVFRFVEYFVGFILDGLEGEKDNIRSEGQFFKRRSLRKRLF